MTDAPTCTVRPYDRSRVLADWKCPRSRYWGYEYGGTGLSSGNTSIELYTGIVTHDGLAAIAHGVPIDDIAKAAFTQMKEALLAQSNGTEDDLFYAEEQATLVEGMLRGFYKHVWPRLMAAYPTILYVEEEMFYPHDGLMFMSKGDLILQDKEGENCYLEYKTTSTKKEEWIASWDTAVQVHSTIKAVKATTGLDINRVIVQGLYKGYRSYNKQNSPFCYSYRREGKPPFVPDSFIYEYKAGYFRFPTWKMDGGVAVWIEGMPEAMLADQFPQTPPIFINHDLVEAFFRQRTFREHKIQQAIEILHEADEDITRATLDVAFPQKFDMCVPPYGHPCMFRKLCHSGITDPLAAGYIPRVPHHQYELDQWNAKGHEDQPPSSHTEA